MVRQTLSYPLEAVNGDLKLSNGIACDFEAIAAVLETRPGERIMRPFTFGYEPALFEPIPSPDIPAKRIEVSLLDQVPQIVQCYCQGSLVESEGELRVDVYFVSTEGEAKAQMKITGVVAS